MDQLNQLFTLFGASAGFLSILWNFINSRRAYLESLTPKLNMDLESKRVEDIISNTMHIENVGQSDVYIRTIQFYAIDEGFIQTLHFGPAIYTSDLVIYNNKLMNRSFGINAEISYDNLVKALAKIFSRSEESVRKEFTNQKYQKILDTNLFLPEDFPPVEGFSTAILIRSAFLIESILKEIINTNEIEVSDLPPAYESILFNESFYTSSRIKKSIDSLDRVYYRMDWEKNPMLDINDSPLVTLTPDELGIPAKLSPFEKRSIDFQIPVLHDGYFRIKTILYVSKIVPKFLILKKDVTTKYQYYIRGKLK